MDELEVGRKGVLVGGELLVAARLDGEARERVEAWIRWQVAQGQAPDDVRRMLTGQYATPRASEAMLLAEANGDAALLDGTIAELEAKLGEGDWDGSLGALREAEVLGRGRKGAVEAIDRRIELRDALAELAASIPELTERLASGELDDALEGLLALEREHRGRKGAVAALACRAEAVGAEVVLDGPLAVLDRWLEGRPDRALIVHLREVEAAGKGRKGALERLDRALG